MWIVTLSFLFVGLFAPLIANDVPLVASVTAANSGRRDMEALGVSTPFGLEGLGCHAVHPLRTT